ADDRGEQVRVSAEGPVEGSRPALRALQDRQPDPLNPREFPFLHHHGLFNCFEQFADRVPEPTAGTRAVGALRLSGGRLRDRSKHVGQDLGPNHGPAVYPNRSKTREIRGGKRPPSVHQGTERPGRVPPRLQPPPGIDLTPVRGGRVVTERLDPVPGCGVERQGTGEPASPYLIPPATRAFPK